MKTIALIHKGLLSKMLKGPNKFLYVDLEVNKTKLTAIIIIKPVIILG
jgi:hypothetical protein